MNPEFVPVLNQFGEYLSTVICVMSSISRVKVEEYQLLQGIQQILQDNFPLMSIISSLHKVLAFAWELIEKNECGLGVLD